MTVEQMINNIPAKLFDATLINPGYMGMYAWKYNEKEGCYQSKSGSRITPSSLTIKRSDQILHYEYQAGKITSFYEYYFEGSEVKSVFSASEFDNKKVMLMEKTIEGAQYIIKFSADKDDPFIFSIATVSKESLEEISLGYDFMNRLTISALRQTFGEERKSETESRIISCDDPLDMISFILNHPTLESVLQYFSSILNYYYFDPSLIEDLPESIKTFLTIIRERVSSNIVDPEQEIAPILKFANIALISHEFPF